METPFVNINNRSSNTKTIALVALAVVGTLAACLVVAPATTQTVVLSDTINPTALYDLYSHWKSTHGFQYGGAEDKYRFQVFSTNYHYIFEHNKNTSKDFELGLNQFASLTPEEYSAIYLGYKADLKTKDGEVVELPTDNLPESIDWREKGAVTPVKDQGQCGSCWAFSTTGALEGANFLSTGKLLSFSEQQLVDCSTKYGNNGCNGGLMDYGFAYVKDNGIELESNYPYKAVDGKCKYEKGSVKFTNKGYNDVAHNNPDQLKAAIANGPVSVAIEADQSAFQFYKSGVLTSGCGTSLDHGVLAVGYGTENGKPYFLVKNSWAATWGDQGYVKIGIKNGAGVCGINQDASYPTA